MSYRPHPWRVATSATTAAQVRNLMLGVTQIPGGTGYGLFAPNDNVAAKTGTAETGTTGCTANWFIATAPAGAWPDSERSRSPRSSPTAPVRPATRPVRRLPVQWRARCLLAALGAASQGNDVHRFETISPDGR